MTQTTSFALHETLAERKLQRKSQQESNLNTSTFKKPILTNGTSMLPALVLSTQSLTTITHGQVASAGYVESEVESEAYMGRLDCCLGGECPLVIMPP